MPEQQWPTPQQTWQPPNRYDVGSRQFSNPVSDDDRGGGDSSNSARQEQLQDPYLYGDPFLYGGYDPYSYQYLDSAAQASSPFLAEGESWGEVQQTDLAMLEESGMLREYGEDAVLVVANGPEDMRQLNHEAEATNIANAREGRETVVLWNPSPEAMEAMLRQGGFKDVVVSGHGDQGQLYMTGADGTAVAMDAESVASMFEDSGVENVFLNVCHGAGGKDSVAQALAEVGLNAMGWTDSVKDSEAGETAADWAARTTDGADVEDLEATAQGDAELDVVRSDEVSADGSTTATNETTTPTGEPAAPATTPVEQPAPAEPAPAEADPYAGYARWNAGGGMWLV